MCFISLRTTYLHKLFEIFLSRRFVYLLQFIYLFSHFYQYGYLFYTLVLFRFLMIQHFIHFVAQIVVVPVSCWHPSINVDCAFCLLSCLYVLSTSLSRSSYVFLAPGPELAIIPRSPHSFYQTIILETKIWVLGVLFATGVLFLLGPLSWSNKEICVYVY